MLTDVHVSGRLAEVVGSDRVRLAVASPGEAARALCANWPDARPVLEAGRWRVTVGGRPVVDDAEIGLRTPGRVFRFDPVIEGEAPRGAKGIGKILGGLLLFLIPGAPAFVGLAGLALGVSGFASLFQTPDSDYGEREEPTERPSFVFRGPINSQQPGEVVPVAYGRILVGSVVASASQTTVQEGSSEEV